MRRVEGAPPPALYRVFFMPVKTAPKTKATPPRETASPAAQAAPEPTPKPPERPEETPAESCARRPAEPAADRPSALTREALLPILRPLLFVPAGQSNLSTLTFGKFKFKREGRRHVLRFASYAEFAANEAKIREENQGMFPILTDFEVSTEAPPPVREPVRTTTTVPPTREELIATAILHTRGLREARRREWRLTPEVQIRERITARRLGKLPPLGDVPAAVELLMKPEDAQFRSKLREALLKLDAPNIDAILAKEFPGAAEAEADGPSPFAAETDLPRVEVEALELENLRAYAAFRGVTERDRAAIIQGLFPAQ